MHLHLNTFSSTAIFSIQEAETTVKQVHLRYTESLPTEIETSEEGNTWKKYIFDFDLFAKYIRKTVEEETKEFNGEVRYLTLSHDYVLKNKDQIDGDLNRYKIYVNTGLKVMYYAVRTLKKIELFFVDQNFSKEVSEKITDLMKNIKIEEWQNHFVHLCVNNKTNWFTTYSILPTDNYINYIQAYRAELRIKNGLEEALEILKDMEPEEVLRKYNDEKEEEQYKDGIVLRAICTELKKHHAIIVLRPSGYYIQKNK